MPFGESTSGLPSDPESGEVYRDDFCAVRKERPDAVEGEKALHCS
jgi:hypothetical protein